LIRRFLFERNEPRNGGQARADETKPCPSFQL
jgi:hypothetical protein